jgi:flagellar hook-associated protein 1 FlgK
MNLSTAARIAHSSLSSVTGETSVLSRNIAGAGQDFSSRKIVSPLSTGVGSELGTVTRAESLAAFANVLSSTANAAAKDSLAEGLERLAATLGDVSTGTGSPEGALSEFTDAFQDFAGLPSDSTSARSVVSSASKLADTLGSASKIVQDARALADADMAQSIQTINSLLDQFRAANEQVVRGSANGTDVTDALDQRDAILAKLATEIGITTTLGAKGDMSIYTDSGVTLFQGGAARSVAFESTATYTASTTGKSVYIDGVPVTGASIGMPLVAGTLAGAAAFRDDFGVTYQAQLDGIASALVTAFAESDQIGSGPDLPGLFTTSGATALPTTVLGLAARIVVNPSVDPAQGGDIELMRDGGIAAPGNPNYDYNTTGDASYTGRIDELFDKLTGTSSFGADGKIGTSASLADYAAASVGWLSSERKQVASERDYQDVLLSAATSAFSDATGIDLDSEMSKMLALEQAYSATAKLISTIDAMFGALVNAV